MIANEFCTRSHPHEAMDRECELLAEIARLNSESVHLKAELTASKFREAAARREALLEAVPYADIRRAIAHTKDNANALKQFEGSADEARCRQLCAAYLDEWIISHEMGKKLELLERAASRVTEGEG